MAVAGGPPGGAGGDVVLVDLPDAVVRRVRQRLPPAAVPGLAQEHAAGPLGPPWLVRHGGPGTGTEPDGEVDVEAEVPVATGTPGGVWRAGGRFAALTVHGDDARHPRLLQAFARAAEHARAAGLELTGPPRERHLPGGAVQVAWPVEEPQTGG